MLALKLTLVPLFLMIVSMSGKWWGPSVAGWIAGLPVVAGPILFLLALERGAAFAAHAAGMALAAIVASEAFNFAYAWSCRRWPWPVALANAFTAWGMSAGALAALPASPAYAATVAAVAVLCGQSFLPKAGAVAPQAPLGYTDLAGRMAAGAVLTLAVTSLSAWAGASWSGLLAVFPLLGSVLAVSSHRAHGPDFVVSLMRGMVLGRFSFAAFCLALAATLPAQPVPAAFVEAAVLAMFVQWCTKRLALNRRRESAISLEPAPSRTAEKAAQQ
ncbi:hypothetical protein WKR88_28610 [Trinickia caryophylli]|uniref:Uncharacterized protein n=1 Tax=Trinickia caryophylli TaxID=28094 RepID=A0A1X7DXI8_TRICW|nr:hypothetical protein [Trinickia caryophylli]PMS14209.1 hypothetical protein C0Z17_01375 [Trinickia caryophylli]TRX17907.1 hypothetical protein FNF07_06500 [Trinickia caryophylli]WQE11321.1 hypothetical protein U0034_16425 [Trinickia caryophylli]SMF23216.1 hypothetical protein SAMN06295900_104165 [Trinickia caryophylli]GLU32474.1 hypothetical protein Busp01_23160 [Trinickia caryophylli]